jgi:hypothetical protein
VSDGTGRATLAARWILALAMASAAGAQEVDLGKVAAVKAGFILNFIRYTTWPPASFDGPASPYSVVVIGSDAVADRLQEIAQRGGAIADRRGLAVTRLDLPKGASSTQRTALLEQLRRAHVLYVGDQDVDAALALLPDLAGHDVLTVGDGTGFAVAGGMIGLWRNGDRIVFDANPRVIRATGLAVSARVLKLAHIVDGGVAR